MEPCRPRRRLCCRYFKAVFSYKTACLPANTTNNTVPGSYPYRNGKVEGYYGKPIQDITDSIPYQEKTPVARKRQGGKCPFLKANQFNISPGSQFFFFDDNNSFNTRDFFPKINGCLDIGFLFYLVGKGCCNRIGKGAGT